MKSARRGSGGLALVLAALSVSCGDAEAPLAAAPEYEQAEQYRVVRFSAATAPEVQAVRLNAHQEAVSKTARIGVAGGTIQVGNATVVIPPDALTQAVDITVRLPDNDFAVLELEPHGLMFRKWVQISYSLADTDAAQSAEAELAGVYTGVPVQDGKAWAWEVMQPKLNGSTFTFYTTHFSIYCIARAGFILVGG